MLSLEQMNYLRYNLIPFSSGIFLPNNNMKIKNYKDFKNLKPFLNKILKKGFGLINVGIHFNFLLTCSLPSQELKNFHETSV